MQRISHPIHRPASPSRSHSPLSASVPSRLPRAFWSAFLAAAALSTPVLSTPAWSAPAAAGKTASAQPAPRTTTVETSDRPQSQIAAQKSGPASRTQWQPPSVTVEVTPGSTPAQPKAAELKAGTNETRIDRVAAAAAPGTIDVDKPPAAPVENPPALQVPIKPDTSEQPTPAGAPGAGAEGTTPPATPPLTTPATPDGATPALPDANALAPADAEGREIAAVRVFGNRVITEDTINLAIKGIKPGAAFSVRQAELDKRNVRGLGFFAGVDYQVVPNLQDPNKVDVIFVVIENRVVSKFSFVGNTQVPTSELEGVLTSKTGAVLSSGNVDDDVKKIQEYYRAQGFAALVTDVKQEADGTIVYTIQEGRISKIDLEGLKKTKPSIVRSVILSKPGDPFNERKVQQDLNRIYDLGFFEDVSYRIGDDPETPGALVVTIVLKERRTGSINFGVGFDSRSKISGFAGVSESNYAGTGKNVSAQVELGATRSFSVGFGDRFVGDKNASYQISVFDQTNFREPRSIERIIGKGVTNNDKTFVYEERRQGTRLNYTHPLDFERTRNILFGYRFERIKLFLRDDDDNSVPVDLPVDSSGRSSAISVGFLRDRRDLKTDPSRGGRELITFEQGLSALGGTSNFSKADLDVRRYFPLIKAPKARPGEVQQLPRLVLAGRFVLGQTFGQLPVFEQYFIGGSDTVRGYDSDEQFGDNQIFGNLELRFRLQRKIQLVAFADAGSAYGGSFTSADSLDPIFGVGVGARLVTPIGPIRLDIAKGDRGIKTHFGIGSTF